MAQYFQSSNKRGELYELSEELSSTDFSRKKEAIKKVIAHMTIGKDVSPLFHPVVKCLEYNDIELKKLVYLYIINYSRNKPDDAIVVIQLFRKDIQNKTNPLLRALAVRTMGCLRVHKLNEYLADPLKDALNDKEPYVRKTAVLCIPKLFEVSQELVEEVGLITTMQELLEKETNSMVLSNLIIALTEISQIKKTELITINQNILQRLLLAVNECVEWGQINIMEYLSNYIPSGNKEAESIIERILPRLSHINPAVAFSAVKVILKYFDHIDSPDIVNHLCSKLTPPLVSLLSWDKPEIKFIILKSINHILAKQPGLLDKDYKCFFCNFNEPYYIKHQKLDILARICDKKSSEAVLNELELYVTESDSIFVRRSIKAICSIAIRFSNVSEKALKIILNCTKNILEAKMGGELYVQEIIISAQKLYRKYPNKIKYENGLHEIVKILEFAQEEEAKSSALWILGEFAEHIAVSIEMITQRIETFLEEERGVQLEILTAAIKIFVKYPDDGKNFIQELLETAAYKTLNPDVRDRGYIYWRMLSIDPEKTKSTVLCSKPDIEEEGLQYEQDFLNVMIDTLGQVSSIFQVLPHKIFTGRNKPPGQSSSTMKSVSVNKEQQNTSSKSEPKPAQKSPEKKKVVEEVQEKKKETVVEPPKPASDNLLDLDDEPPQISNSNQQSSQNQQQQGDNNLLDLMDDMGAPPQQQQQQQNNNDDDIFGNDQSSQQQQGVQLYKIPLEQVMDSNHPGKRNQVTGLTVQAAFNRTNGKTQLDLKLTNNCNQNITDLSFSLRPNYFKLKFDVPSIQISIPNNSTSDVAVPLNTTGNQDANYPNVPLKFDVGIKTNFDVFYFSVPVYFHTLFGANGQLDKGQFKEQWKGVPDENEMSFEVKKFNQLYKNSDNLKQVLQLNNVFHVAQRQNDKGQTVSYYSAKTESDQIFTLEVSVPSVNNQDWAQICVKSHHKPLITLVLQAINYVLSH